RGAAESAPAQNASCMSWSFHGFLNIILSSGFIKSPLSQMKLFNDSAELHCEGEDTIHLTSLTFDDSGTYECRASNDPDRNELKKTPKIKWIRSQANIIVIESEWQRNPGHPTPVTLNSHAYRSSTLSILLHPVYTLPLLFLKAPRLSCSRTRNLVIKRGRAAP
uniref:Ig-like domain-containing protein n=1 Tax=Dicentrarchus labrax TaxID=13489 RepID=A0A8P4GAV8_DICLA